MNPKIFDITPVISSNMGVFPGDVNFTSATTLSSSTPSHLKVSSIHTTVHLGAHVDAPNHTRHSDRGIEAQPLDYYMGPAQVITCEVKRAELVKKESLATDEIKAERILLKTLSFPDPNQWNSDFCGIDPELIAWLAQKKVKLIGIDTPSIDLERSKELLAHAETRKHDLAILEGVILTRVPDGLYQLIALPLPLQGLDASPVRAILIDRFK